MNDIITPGIRLFVICAISVLVLSFASETTKEAIAQQNAKTEAASMQIVLPEATSFENKKELSDGNVYLVADGMDNGELKGYVVGVNSSGFGGELKIMVGISPDGTIQGANVLSHSETPGLGARSQEPEFIEQYKGQKTDKELVVVKGKEPAEGEIQAITAATITSRAVTNGVNEATAYFKTNLAGGAK